MKKFNIMYITTFGDVRRRNIYAFVKEEIEKEANVQIQNFGSLVEFKLVKTRKQK